MDFARKELSKHGWNEGQGLGKDEEGIAEAIKVKVKQDKKGVGHDPGEEFSFHWWDHVFNKAASKIQVNTTEDGVEIKNSGDTKVSRKKNSKTYDSKSMLYGQFVKGSTLSGGTETRETTGASSDEEVRDTTQCLMPDQEEVVFNMCGGRTAHKGARHGLKLNGKLLRIQEQEKLLLESYNSKSANQNEHHSPEKNLNALTAESTVNQETEHVNTKSVKKSKKKKRKHRDIGTSDVVEVPIISDAIEDIDRLQQNDHQSCDERNVSECVHKCKKRKKSKRDKQKTDCDVDNIESVDRGSSDSVINVASTVDEHTYSDVSKKIRNKKKKHKVDM